MAEERRSIAFADAGVEVRAAGDAPARFHGLASLYNVRAPIGNPKTWGFFEDFMPGTFADSLAADDQRFLVDHDSYYVVSRRSAGTLDLADTSRGVEPDSALDQDLSYVRDLIANVRNGNITGMSIGFIVTSGGDTWSTIDVEEPRPDGKIEVYQADLRTIHSAKLLEVSAVTWPAFVDTEASLRFGVMPALAMRGDRHAIESRAEYRPELAELLRGDLRSLPTTRPAATRNAPADLDRRMSGLAARYRISA